MEPPQGRSLIHLAMDLCCGVAYPAGVLSGRQTTSSRFKEYYSYYLPILPIKQTIQMILTKSPVIQSIYTVRVLSTRAPPSST